MINLDSPPRFDQSPERAADVVQEADVVQVLPQVRDMNPKPHGYQLLHSGFFFRIINMSMKTKL